MSGVNVADRPSISTRLAPTSHAIDVSVSTSTSSHRPTDTHTAPGTASRRGP